uniref:Coiled-coil domain-containing protein 34 n=2 Tax=Cyprinus carpio TaxID=7962 RepID=A0A8C1BN28_CYPCA
MSKVFQKSKEQLQEEKRRAEIEKKAQEKYKEWLRKKKQDEMERKLQEKVCPADEKHIEKSSVGNFSKHYSRDYNNVNYPAPSFVNPIPWKPIHVPQQERTPRKGSALLPLLKTCSYLSSISHPKDSWIVCLQA